MKQCGIYCYRNKINNKKYIGQSVDLEKRKRCFGRKFTYSGRLFQNAIKKYGKENFEYSVLTHCKKEELNYFEQFYISRLKTNNRNKGYNQTSGGDSQYFRSEEWKRNISNSWDIEKRREQSENNKGEKNGNWGNKWNTEQKEHASVIRKKLVEKKFFELNGFYISELENKIIEYISSKEEATKKEIMKHFHISYAKLCSILENNFVLKKELNKKSKKSIDKQKKIVVQCNINDHNIILNIFPSLSDAVRITKMQSIKHCLYGKQYHAYGYYWRWGKNGEKPLDEIDENYIKPTYLYNKLSKEGLNNIRKKRELC